MSDRDQLREAIENAITEARERGVGRKQIEDWIDYTLDLADENEMAEYE
jgi:DNA-binding transcriptional regulator YhcF (GntR family)